MISQRIRQLRLEKNLTLDQLAARSGINRGTIHRIESGEGSPRVDTLESLCRALGIELHDFFLPTNRIPSDGADDVTAEGMPASPVLPPSEEPYPSRKGHGIREGLLDWFEHLEALVHESMDMLAVLDKDGFILYESPSTMHMLGCSRGERCTQPWFHWVHPEDQAHP